MNENIKKALEDKGYDFAVAVATDAEIKAKAACGQLAIIVESENENNHVNEDIKKALEANGYDFAVAVATEAEIKAKAACGQLAIIVESEES